MTDVPQSDSSQPGKTRTMWHPLLVRMLRFALDSAFRVNEEVSVGKLPLRVDILLVRQEGGQISEAMRQKLSMLLALLNRFTLIEFKGPTDVMERGDFAQLLGCSFLWHSQESELIPSKEVSLVVLLPMVTGPLRQELRALECEIRQQEPGIFRVAGLPFVAWLVETDVMAEHGHPIISLVSRVFLNDRQSIIKKLARGGQGPLVQYMVQQIRQFDSEEDLAMQQALSENLAELADELFTKMIEEAPAERRLRGLSPEELLRVMSPEQLVAALSDEQAARLRELLDRKQGR